MTGTALTEEEVLGVGAKKLSLNQLPEDRCAAYTTGIVRIIGRVQAPMEAELE